MCCQASFVNRNVCTPLDSHSISLFLCFKSAFPYLFSAFATFEKLFPHTNYTFSFGYSLRMNVYNFCPCWKLFFLFFLFVFMVEPFLLLIRIQIKKKFLLVYHVCLDMYHILRDSCTLSAGHDIDECADRSMCRDSNRVWWSLRKIRIGRVILI